MINEWLVFWICKNTSCLLKQGLQNRELLIDWISMFLEEKPGM